MAKKKTEEPRECMLCGEALSSDDDVCEFCGTSQAIAREFMGE